MEPIDPQQALARYIRARLQREQNEYEATHGRGYQAKVARESKVSTAHIANIITRDGQGVGMDTAKRLASFWGMTLDKLMATAGEWAKTAPPAPQSTSGRRRANLETAIDVLRRKGGLSDDIVAEARRTGSRDFSVGAWMILLGEMMQAERDDGPPVSTSTAATAPRRRARPAS